MRCDFLNSTLPVFVLCIFVCVVAADPMSPEGLPASLFLFLTPSPFKVVHLISLKAIMRLLCWNPIGITAPRAAVNYNYNELESWARI